MKNELKQTKYVIVLDYQDDMYFEDACLLGWDSRYNWYVTDIGGDEMMTAKGNIKRNRNGFIDIGRGVSAYASDKYDWLFKYAKAATKEGYISTICKIEKEYGELILTAVLKF